MAVTATGRFGMRDLWCFLTNIRLRRGGIFAGMLRDDDRALIVGREVSGKPRNGVDCRDGSAVRLTVNSVIALPSGRCIRRITVLVSAEPERDIASATNMAIFRLRQHSSQQGVGISPSAGRKVYGGGHHA